VLRKRKGALGNDPLLNHRREWRATSADLHHRDENWCGLLGETAVRIKLPVPMAVRYTTSSGKLK